MPSANDLCVKVDRNVLKAVLTEYAKDLPVPPKRALLHYVLRSWIGYHRAAQRRAINGEF